MAETEFKGKVGTDFEGNKLKEPIEFTYEATQYKTYDEVPVESKLSPGDCLAVVNASEKASARAKATAKTLTDAGYTKPDPNSKDVIRVNMIKSTMKLFGVDEATATQAVDGIAAAVKS